LIFSFLDPISFDINYIYQVSFNFWVSTVITDSRSVTECRTVAIGIVPLCKVVTPVYKHRDNDCTQWCDLDSDSPALSHRDVKNTGLLAF